mmetsp:Transcript_5251/g.6977  ORF Transcript_5251/g.6977 Transcript_5251/m.6977 type:complete len:146 (+) Transcript_5251:159-596(+)|eukprot:CAMPEP_0184028902 /NCGR_PEP_ID=MMETSP0954-20121128/15117_1 /TAXON_ID=627963 /ORGANISM="Aplanochytrium sp, Strain PBS07" /LENGTH=145 /DNA_ID=CAMNT_0026313835 /DNA_START=85 /DNA_END=522 /DNA_ORIENTATION=-
MEIVITVNLFSLLVFFLCLSLCFIYMYKVFKADLDDRALQFQQKFREGVIDAFSGGVTEVLKKEEVHLTLTNIIAAGISTWIDGDGQAHVGGLVDSKNQKLVAREIGKNLPGLVGGVTAGVVDSINPFKKKNKNSSDSTEAKKHR